MLGWPLPITSQLDMDYSPLTLVITIMIMTTTQKQLAIAKVVDPWNTSKTVHDVDQIANYDEVLSKEIVLAVVRNHT